MRRSKHQQLTATQRSVAKLTDRQLEQGRELGELRTENKRLRASADRFADANVFLAADNANLKRELRFMKDSRRAAIWAAGCLGLALLGSLLPWVIR